MPTEQNSLFLAATAKKGGKKGGEKKTYKNPNKDKTCNHCKKKGHLEPNCWEKHPDKMPEKVKTARNKAKSMESKKSSTKAAAVEEEIILGSIETAKVHENKIDAKDAYMCLPIVEECNYIFLNDEIESNKEEASEESSDFDIYDLLSVEKLAAMEMEERHVTQL